MLQQTSSPVEDLDTMANGLHFYGLIHEIGFPGWPELNLD
jgi:hypothetical protein